MLNTDDKSEQIGNFSFEKALALVSNEDLVLI